MLNDHEVEAKLNFNELINETAKSAYRKVAEIPELKANEADMPALRLCTFVCQEMQKELELLGINSEVVELSGGWDMIYHQCLKVEHNGTIYHVDPTWKQFIGAGDIDFSTVPDVLIAEMNKAGQISLPDNLPAGLAKVYRNNQLAEPNESPEIPSDLDAEYFDEMAEEWDEQARAQYDEWEKRLEAETTRTPASAESLRLLTEIPVGEVSYESREQLRAYLVSFMIENGLISEETDMNNYYYRNFSGSLLKRALRTGNDRNSGSELHYPEQIEAAKRLGLKANEVIYCSMAAGAIVDNVNWIRGGLSIYHRNLLRNVSPHMEAAIPGCTLKEALASAILIHNSPGDKKS